MMCIDVEDPQNAIFFENVIAQRDLVAFGASSPDEMNTLLRQVLVHTTWLTKVLFHSSFLKRQETDS